MPHTPRPWHADFSGGKVSITDENNMTVAYVTYDGGGERQVANAFLIAALPELLEAAEDVLEQYRKSIVPIGPDLADSIRVLLAAAVRKAKQV